MLEAALNIVDNERWDREVEYFKGELGNQGASDLFVAVGVEAGLPL